MTIQFDPSTAINVTLSNGGLTGTNTSTANPSGCKGFAADAKSSGKWYFEVRGLSTNGGSQSSVGLNTPSSTIANQVTVGGGGGGVGLYQGGSGAIFISGSNTGVTINGSPSATDVIGVAVDLDHMKVWFKNITKAGPWNQPTAGADPATNVGGLSITATPLVPFFGWGGGGSVGQPMTANFTGPFVTAMPAGFASWDFDPSIVALKTFANQSSATANPNPVTNTVTAKSGDLILIAWSATVTAGFPAAAHTLSGGSSGAVTQFVSGTSANDGAITGCFLDEMQASRDINGETLTSTFTTSGAGLVVQPAAVVIVVPGGVHGSATVQFDATSFHSSTTAKTAIDNSTAVGAGISSTASSQIIIGMTCGRDSTAASSLLPDTAHGFLEAYRSPNATFTNNLWVGTKRVNHVPLAADQLVSSPSSFLGWIAATHGFQVAAAAAPPPHPQIVWML